MFSIAWNWTSYSQHTSRCADFPLNQHWNPPAQWTSNKFLTCSLARVRCTDMDWYVGPPSRPPPHHWQLVVHQLPRHHMQQHIISRFGWSFWMVVAQSPVAIVLPMVTYGEIWTLALYILDWCVFVFSCDWRNLSPIGSVTYRRSLARKVLAKLKKVLCVLLKQTPNIKCVVWAKQN